jgi:predicted dipeptidase
MTFRQVRVAALVTASVLAFAPCAQVAAIASEPIAKHEIAVLRQSLEGRSFADLESFLTVVANESSDRNLTRAILAFQDDQPLAESARVNVFRLMGLYNRIKHRDIMLDTLARLVAIPTDKKEGRAQFENPEIIRFGRELEGIARAVGLDYRNIDNRIFEVTLKGAGPEALGVYTHADVVPADAAKWVLDDGTRLDPFSLTIIGDRLYGRGTEDDKCAIVAALFAMKTIKDAGLPLKRSIRLIIETTEETSGEGIEYYKKHHSLPGHNVVLDGIYPLGIAEKGFGLVWAGFPLRRDRGGGPEVIEMKGGLATNQIPARATAVIKTSDPAALRETLLPVAASYSGDHGVSVEIDLVEPDDDRIVTTVTGNSAHSAHPASGINPVPRLFGFIYEALVTIPLKQNHFTDAASYVVENWGLDYYGRTLGIEYSDPFMGPLTTSVTYIGLHKGKFWVAVNLRAPRGKKTATLERDILDKLESWRNGASIEATFSVRVAPYMYRDPKGQWITALLNIFGDVTGLAADPVASSGATTARQLPNGVQFGPQMPGERASAHNANEFKTLKNFLLDVQIYTEMIARLGTMHSLE